MSYMETTSVRPSVRPSVCELYYRLNRLSDFIMKFSIGVVLEFFQENMSFVKVSSMTDTL